ncbi:hypothetical protein Bca4012_009971 [Brassica carinata]
MGGKGRICFKDAICRQTTVINFVEKKDIGEMFSQWDSDVEDPAVENIIKVMFNQRPWKWTMDCLEVTGTWVKSLPAVLSPAKKEIVVKEDSPRPRKKARKEATTVPPTEAHAEAHEEASEEVPTEATMTVGGMTKEDLQRCFKDLADGRREGFGMCLKEFKHLSDRVEALEKVVGITEKGKGTSSDDLQNTTSPPKPTHEPGVSTSPNTSQKILSRKSSKKKN